MSEKTPPLSQEPLNVGDMVLDRYRVVEQLAEGGHSVVYRGRDERLARPVCIKVFHDQKHRDGVYRTSYQHFVQEAFALSKLTHPNTLRIYDFGHLESNETDDDNPGAPFQVSEFANGGTLSSQVFSYKHYLDGNGELIDPKVMVTIARAMIRNKPDSYCLSWDLRTEGITEFVHQLNMLYVDFGMDPAARFAYMRDRPARGEKAPGRMRRAWDKLLGRNR